MTKRISIRTIKLIACSLFILIGLINLIETLIYLPNYYLRDTIILLILGSPLLINKRAYYVIFGLLASVISFVILIVYVIYNYPSQIDNSISFYFLGILLYLFALACSVALIYVGSYSKEQNRFRLI